MPFFSPSFDAWHRSIAGNNQPSPMSSSGAGEMTANYGIDSPSNDRTFKQGVDDAQRDFARLLHEHSPTWSLDLLGMLRWTCTCPNPGPRNTAALESHILEAVRKARGPVRGYKR